MKKMVLIPRYVINTLQPAGYFQRFYHLVGASGFSHPEAYLALENDLSRFGLPEGYKDYNSFKRSKNHHMKKRLFRLNDNC